MFYRIISRGFFGGLNVEGTHAGEAEIVGTATRGFITKGGGWSLYRGERPAYFLIVRPRRKRKLVWLNCENIEKILAPGERLC